MIAKARWICLRAVALCAAVLPGLVDARAQCASTSDLDPAGVQRSEPATWRSAPARPCACGAPDSGSAVSPLRSVDLPTGEFVLQVTDLHIRARGLDLSWVRTYRSRSTTDTPQGSGWDFSYNVAIEGCRTSLVVRDGAGRADLFSLVPGAPELRWERRELFSEIREAAEPGSPVNNQYVMTFPDTGRWEFHAFNPVADGAAAGRIKRIIDRNGNTIRMTYDPIGRLVRVDDPLSTPANPRFLLIAYNAQGRISTVTDFTGRIVRYTYSADGDLLTATGPAVTGTPHGNDFPAGKTVSYTYTSGSADERLNHNLLSITDAKGQTWLRNTYAATTNPADLDFDRVVHQQLGDPGEDLFVSYTRIAPNGPNIAAIRAIVNDRNRNVTEWDYDGLNRLVARRVFTGRAPAAAPTTPAGNRPVLPLRADDPPFYQSTYEYNSDSLPVRIVHPNGSATLHAYESAPSAPRRSRGNLLAAHRLPGPLGADQAMLSEYFEYDTAGGGGGGCCGTNFVTRHIDARGHETRHTYDPRGNRLHTDHRIPGIIEDFTYNAFGQLTSHTHPANGSGHRRVDTMDYYAPGDGHQYGYPRSQTIDAGGPQLLTTRYEYDPRGNAVRTIDPRGNDTLVDHNQLDQPVRIRSRALAPLPPPDGLRYTTLNWYDANDNVVRTDVANLDERGLPVRDLVGPPGMQSLVENPAVTTLYAYDTLNRQIVTCTEKGTANLADDVVSPAQVSGPGLRPEFIFTATVYDANRNVVETLSGEAMRGTQARNRVVTQYDERDLPFRTTRAPRTVPPSPTEPDGIQSTVQFDYDASGNMRRTLSGIEAPFVTDPDRRGDGLVRRTAFTYDGFDRQLSVTDAMGNVSRSAYDANSNRILERREGEPVDGPGSIGNVRLSETVFQYDAMDRLIRTDRAFFDADTQAPILDGQSTALTIYAPDSQPVQSIDDLGNSGFVQYDSANRRLQTTDALGNSIRYEYDANSNVIRTTETERRDTPPHTTEVYQTNFLYDALDRRIATIDNIGNTSRYAYDSRGNQSRLTDANGNQTRALYDSAGRPTASIIDMNGDLTPDPGQPVQDLDIVTRETYDDNHRCTSRTDDGTRPLGGGGGGRTPHPNTTSDTFDARDNPVSTSFEDCPDQDRFYDIHGNLLSECQQRGTRVICRYDLLNRLVRKDVDVNAACNAFSTHDNLPAAPDTTFEIYLYDGLSRLRESSNDLSTVLRSYDSLGHVTRESQFLVGTPAAVVVCEHDGAGNRTRIVYPGGRTISLVYDALNRVKSVSDADGLIAEYEFIGPGRITRKRFGNGTVCDVEYNGQQVIPPAPSADQDYGIRQVVATTHYRAVDGLVIDARQYRWDRAGNKTLRRDVRPGGPCLAHEYCYDAAYRLCRTIVTCPPSGSPFGPPVPVRDTAYQLDDVGNRLSVTGVGTLDAGDYGQVPDCTATTPADLDMNQYTSTPFDCRVYDDNGNLIGCGACPPVQPRVPANLRRVLGASGPIATEAELDAPRLLVELMAESAPGAPPPGGTPNGPGGPSPLSSTRFRPRYDYADRMVAHEDALTGVRHEYRYDALGRRIARIIAAAGPTPTLPPQTPLFTRFLLDGWREIEEQSAAGATLATYVFGGYIDDAITMTRFDRPTAPGVPVEHFFHTDDLCNIMALSDDAGATVERYEYDDYGAPRTITATAVPGVRSLVGNPLGFTGRRLDVETGWWYFRTRYLDPRGAKFTTRDRLGGWFDAANHGNALAYAGGNPWSRLDPMGTQSKKYTSFADLAKDTAISQAKSQMNKRLLSLGKGAAKELGKLAGADRSLPKEDCDALLGLLDAAFRFEQIKKGKGYIKGILSIYSAGAKVDSVKTSPLGDALRENETLKRLGTVFNGMFDVEDFIEAFAQLSMMELVELTATCYLKAGVKSGRIAFTNALDREIAQLRWDEQGWDYQDYNWMHTLGLRTWPTGPINRKKREFVVPPTWDDRMSVSGGGPYGLSGGGGGISGGIGGGMGGGGGFTGGSGGFGGGWGPFGGGHGPFGGGYSPGSNPYGHR